MQNCPTIWWAGCDVPLQTKCHNGHRTHLLDRRQRCRLLLQLSRQLSRPGGCRCRCTLAALLQLAQLLLQGGQLCIPGCERLLCCRRRSSSRLQLLSQGCLLLFLASQSLLRLCRSSLCRSQLGRLVLTGLVGSRQLSSQHPELLLQLSSTTLLCSRCLFQLLPQCCLLLRHGGQLALQLSCCRLLGLQRLLRLIRRRGCLCCCGLGCEQLRLDCFRTRLSSLKLTLQLLHPRSQCSTCAVRRCSGSLQLCLRLVGCCLCRLPARLCRCQLLC